MLTVTVQLPDLLKGDLSQTSKAAAYRAIYRTVDGIKTDISKEVRNTFNVSKKDIDVRLDCRYPDDFDHLEGMVTLSEKADGKSNLPLILFGASSRQTVGGQNMKLQFKSKSGMNQKVMKNAGKSGVSFKVLRSGGKGYRGDAQIMKGGGSSYQVVRFLKGVKGRKRIKELRVISIPQMVMGKHGLLDRIKTAADVRMKTNYESALKYFLENPAKVIAGSSKGGRS